MSTLGESSNQGPGRARGWHVPKVVGVLLVLAVAFWAGERVGDKVDAIAQSVVDLRQEHDRLCLMYGLFGFLGAEGIKPEEFPLCGKARELLTLRDKEE